VDVRIHQPGHCGAALQVDRLGAGAGQPLDLAARAHRDDLAILDRQRLGRRVRGVHREQPPVQEQ
jgi:hypothetical protein